MNGILCYTYISSILTTSQQGRNYYSHFSVEEPEAQRGQVICSRSHNCKWQNLTLNSGHVLVSNLKWCSSRVVLEQTLNPKSRNPQILISELSVPLTQSQAERDPMCTSEPSLGLGTKWEAKPESVDWMGYSHSPFHRQTGCQDAEFGPLISTRLFSLSFRLNTNENNSNSVQQLRIHTLSLKPALSFISFK